MRDRNDRDSVLDQPGVREWIDKAVSEAPPLTAEQQRRLRAIFAPVVERLSREGGDS